MQNPSPNSFPDERATGVRDPRPGRRAPDPDRLQRTVQQLLGGFHAGLLDTSFLAFDDPSFDVTMSG